MHQHGWPPEGIRQAIQSESPRDFVTAFRDDAKGRFQGEADQPPDFPPRQIRQASCPRRARAGRCRAARADDIPGPWTPAARRRGLAAHHGARPCASWRAANPMPSSQSFNGPARQCRSAPPKRGARSGARHATTGAQGCNSPGTTQSARLKIGRQGNPGGQEMARLGDRNERGDAYGVVNTHLARCWPCPLRGIRRDRCTHGYW